MAQTKDQKKKIVQGLKEDFSKQKAVLMVGIAGLKVKEISVLRKELKAADAKIQVVKKTLASLVLKENSLEFDKNKFQQEIALVFGFKDEISPAKAVYKFSKDHENLKILGGYLENQFKAADDIVALAQIPSYEELLAKFVGTISNPISGFVNVLNGNIKGLVVALDAIGKSK